MSHLLGGNFELKAQGKKRFGEDLVEHITMQGSLPIWPVSGRSETKGLSDLYWVLPQG